MVVVPSVQEPVLVPLRSVSKAVGHQKVPVFIVVMALIIKEFLCVSLPTKGYCPASVDLFHANSPFWCSRARMGRLTE